MLVADTGGGGSRSAAGTGRQDHKTTGPREVAGVEPGTVVKILFSPTGGFLGATSATEVQQSATVAAEKKYSVFSENIQACLLLPTLAHACGERPQ